MNHNHAQRHQISDWAETVNYFDFDSAQIQCSNFQTFLFWASDKRWNWTTSSLWFTDDCAVHTIEPYELAVITRNCSQYHCREKKEMKKKESVLNRTFQWLQTVFFLYEPNKKIGFSVTLVSCRLKSIAKRNHNWILVIEKKEADADKAGRTRHSNKTCI